MPELPEVEMYARYFARYALGQKIVRVRVLDARIAGTRKLPMLVGRSFVRVRRHGKHLFAKVAPNRADGESPGKSKGIPRSARDDKAPRFARDDTASRSAWDHGDVWLRIHFGMTGDLSYVGPASAGQVEQKPAPRFARVIFDFENGAHLAYEDMRLFGVVDLTTSPDDYIRQRGLGPDPLNLRLPEFRRLLEKRRGRIKALLLSQDVIAGIGNLYADEALFRASIDPRRPADRLAADQVKALFTAIRRVMQETIAFKSRDSDYPNRFLVQHRQEGEHCPRCRGTIRRTIVAGRTTYYCTKHQR